MKILENTQLIDGEEVTIRIAVLDSANVAEADSGRSSRGTREVTVAAAENVIETGKDVFGEGVKLAKGCAIQTIAGLQNLKTEYRPDEVELKLSIALKGDAGAVLVNVGAEAQLEVKLKWNLAAKPTA